MISIAVAWIFQTWVKSGTNKEFPLGELLLIAVVIDVLLVFFIFR